MYAEFYGLSGEAFLLTPDHRFYFESSVHSQAMAFLNYGISRGEGFIVITGDIGAGKTTMVGQAFRVHRREAHYLRTCGHNPSVRNRFAAFRGFSFRFDRFTRR